MAGYIGSRAAVATSGVERKKTFAITTTTTSLTGLDYTPNHVHVFHNGIRLVDGTDYTATNGTSITLVNAAENGDEVVVVSYGTFSPADTYTKTEADDRYVNASGDTISGTLFVDGQVNDTDVLRVGYGLTELAVRVDSSDGELRLSAQDGSGNNYTKYMTFYTEGGSGPTEGMRIDPAGRVTMPYQPAFRAKFVSSSQSGAAGIWVFDSVETNVGSGYNSSNGRFTAPVAGRYLIMATAQHYGGTSTGGYVDVYQNGSLIRGMRMEWSNTVSFETRGVSGVFDVSAGDYFHVYNASGTASHLDHSSFSGYLIG